MKKAGEVVGHPLWMLPMMLLVCFGGIEVLHTMAHLHQELDVHGICKQNSSLRVGMITNLYNVQQKRPRAGLFFFGVLYEHVC